MTSPKVSVCVLASGREPARLAAILGLFRAFATEIVVALDDRRSDAANQLAVADRVILFPHRDPGDRPIPWLVGQCRGDWILNVDDDEIPSPTLVHELADVASDSDVTHAWIARRWLVADGRRYLAQPPWSTEYQLRYFRRDERFLRFTSEFHRPIDCLGPARYVDAPLWHLDTALATEAQRRDKAMAYERERRGMRIGPFSHNTGLYVPEAHDDVRLADVPPDDLAVIESVRAAGVPAGSAEVTVERVSAESIDEAWPGEPFDDTAYRASLSLLRDDVPPLVADAQQTIDVRIANDGERTWRFGAVTIGTRWDGVEGIRTQLPADIRPGASRVVPVHVVPPSPGAHRLEIDLVHESIRWFGAPLELEVDAAARRRVVVVGAEPALDDVLDAVALVPSLEPLVVTSSPGMHPASYLRAFAAELRRAPLAIFAGDAAPPGAPPTRALLAFVAAVSAARLMGKTVLHVSAGAREHHGLDAILERVGVTLATRSVPAQELPSQLKVFYAGGGTRTPTPEGRRF